MRTGPEDLILNNIVNAIEGDNLSILNVGSGDGKLSESLRSIGHSVQDLDIGDNAETGSVSPTIFDGIKIPYEQESFDVVLCIYVLHHTKKQQELIEEMKRVAKSRIVLVEDIPERPLDWIFMGMHSLLSIVRGWGGWCKFRSTKDWRTLFETKSIKFVSLEEIKGKWSYPVPHKMFVFKKQP